MIHAEYQRFMQTLMEQNATDPVCKIANIVLSHLDEIISLNGTRPTRGLYEHQYDSKSEN
ncbi:MAG: hypothetical protein V7733_16145 [Paraglaciecola polaris]|uniref:hypothetical protein n=1 Tax=Paraglaciecola polaris TaxID=222814 RepID=UPI0030035CDE